MALGFGEAFNIPGEILLGPNLGSNQAWAATRCRIRFGPPVTLLGWMLFLHRLRLGSHWVCGFVWRYHPLYYGTALSMLEFAPASL